MDQKPAGPKPTSNDAPYEAPQLETVLTPEEVEREVHYAGEATQDVLTN